MMAGWLPVEYQDYILNKIAECDEQAMVTQMPTTFFNVVWPSLWEQSTLIEEGDLCRPPTDNGKIYECTAGGTTGASEPSWGTVQDGTFTDGTVTWKTHDNYALVNTARTPAEFTVSDDISGGRKMVLAEKMGVVTHTAGIVSHGALICHADRTLRHVTEAATTVGNNSLESGRTTIFYALTVVISDLIVE